MLVMMSSMSNRFLERERDLKKKKKTDRETSFEKKSILRYIVAKTLFFFNRCENINIWKWYLIILMWIVFQL